MQQLTDSFLPHFPTCDTNNDYSLSWEESSQCTATPLVSDADLFNQFANGDGLLTFPELLDSILDSITRKDKFLDAAKRQSLGTAFRKFFCSVVSLASSVSGRLKFSVPLPPLL